jgi:DNA primase
LDEGGCLAKEAYMPHEWVNYKSLRAELSFIDILHHYGVELKERGEQWQGFCPLPPHEGQRKSPSFSANVGRGIWQCFGCGAGGNLIEFAARMEGLNPDDPGDFRKAALFLQKTFVGKDGGEQEKPKAVLQEAIQERSGQENHDEERPGSVVNAPLDFELQRLDYGHPYLRTRGFTEETIKTFGLGYCHRGLMKGRIAIPLHDREGALIGYAGRIVDEEAIGKDTPRYLFPGSRERNGTRHEFRKSAFLYNGFRIENALRLVVVESFTAVWWLTQAGITNVVALMSASCSEAQAGLLRDLVPEDGSIWLFPDGDKAGERMAEETLVILAPYRFVRWVKLAGGKQPTDVGPEELYAKLPVV